MAAKLKEMEPGLEAIKKQSAEMTAKAVAIKAQADASAAEHARWQSEVTFVASLNALLDVLKTREGLSEKLKHKLPPHRERPPPMNRLAESMRMPTVRCKRKSIL